MIGLAHFIFSLLVFFLCNFSVRAENTSSLVLVQDLDSTEPAYGATQRALSRPPDLNALSRVKVIDQATGKVVSAKIVRTVTIWIPQGMPSEEAANWIEQIRVIYQNDTQKAKVRVYPIFSSEYESQRLAALAGPHETSQDQDDATPLQQPSVTVSQWIALTLREKVLNSRTFQLQLLGVASALTKSFLSYSFWTHTLGQDPDILRIALVASLGQDAVWGFIPSYMQKIANEWPRLFGFSKFKREGACFLFGLANGLANGILWRELNYQHQQRHLDLIESKDQVASAFTWSYAGDFTNLELVGIVPGSLSVNGVKSAFYKGLIGRTTETGVFQTFGFEMQIKGFVLATLPSLVLRYSLITNALKFGIWAVAKVLPARKGRVLIIHPDIPEAQRKDILYRNAIEMDIPNLILDIPPDHLELDGTIAVYNDGKGVFSVAKPEAPNKISPSKTSVSSYLCQLLFGK